MSDSVGTCNSGNRWTSRNCETRWKCRGREWKMVYGRSRDRGTITGTLERGFCNGGTRGKKKKSCDSFSPLVFSQRARRGSSLPPLLCSLCFFLEYTSFSCTRRLLIFPPFLSFFLSFFFLGFLAWIRRILSARLNKWLLCYAWSELRNDVTLYVLSNMWDIFESILFNQIFNVYDFIAR